MISNSMQKQAIMCFTHAEESLPIIERTISLNVKVFPQETLLSSISFARRSKAMAALECMRLSGIYDCKDGIYNCLLDNIELRTIYLLVKGMTLTPRNPNHARADIVLTLPKPPNKLEKKIKSFGPQTGLIQKTDEIFDHLARQAKNTFIIMTPFLDMTGAKNLIRLFSFVRDGVDKKLILRFLSLGPKYRKYPSGYPSIQDNLKSMKVKVYDYAISRNGSEMLETFHAKTIISDDREAYIGSSNFDQYSLENSMELGTLLTGNPVRLLHSIIKSILIISEPLME